MLVPCWRVVFPSPRMYKCCAGCPFRKFVTVMAPVFWHVQCSKFSTDGVTSPALMRPSNLLSRTNLVSGDSIILSCTIFFSNSVDVREDRSAITPEETGKPLVSASLSSRLGIVETFLLSSFLDDY